MEHTLCSYIGNCVAIPYVIIKSIFEKINLSVLDCARKDGRCYMDICFEYEVCYTGHGIERTKKGCYV